MCNKLVDHLAAERVFDARGELAVGKSTCAALAELHIALGVELALSPKNIDLLRAGIDIRTALKDYRSESRSRKGKRSEKARGAEASNNGSESALAPDRRHDVLILGICLDLGIP